MASEPGSLHLVSRLCLTVASILSEIMNKKIKKDKHNKWKHKTLQFHFKMMM